jgi:protein gp37
MLSKPMFAIMEIKMENSKIEWTDHTFNPWIGCQHVSPGCDHCYAEAMMDHQYGKVKWGPHGERKRTSEANWRKPVKWNATARAFKREHTHRPRVFCASLADVFDNRVPLEWRRDLFALIRECKRLDWLMLTKRPQNIEKMLPADWGDGYRNVWLGVTAENQTYFDQRWKHLQNIPAVIKFISYEPALGPLRLPRHGPLPDWLISGGESGGGARPLDPQWVRDIIADCRHKGVAPFHKQWGTYSSNPLVVQQGMSIEAAKRADLFGKGGGLLDGRIVRDFPTPRRYERRNAA